MSADATGRDFGSDNRAGVHPRILEAIVAANQGHAVSYGDDRWTAGLEGAIGEHFGPDAVALPVFGGTGANVLCLELCGAPHGAVVCPADAHVHVDECGAVERITGMKLLTVDTEHGKLEPADLARFDPLRGEVHHSQPRIVSISQCTELGTLYSEAESRALADAAHERDMALHVDGARIANACAALGASLAELTTEVGVDAVSFGGSKNGGMFGEVVVLLSDRADRERAAYARKQLMQLAAKMRFLSAQFEVLLGDGALWLENARHANAMAARLAEAVAGVAEVELTHPVEANMLFPRIPAPVVAELIGRLGGASPFYVWDERESVVRWVCSWDTGAEEIDRLGRALADAVDAG